MVQATTEGVSNDSPFVPVPGTNHYRWDSEKFYRSLSPAQRRNHDRRMKVYRLQSAMYRHIPWLHWHFIGVAGVFWTSLVEEGPRSTLNPHWGSMAFSYLNDGMKPSLWHTIQQIFFHDGPYSGIWTSGAPKSKADAERKNASYRSRAESTDNSKGVDD